MNGIGSRHAAAHSGLNPATNCRYCSAAKKNPNAAKNCTASERLPMPKPRTANRRGSSSGAGVRHSHSTNATRAARPRASTASASGSSPPRSGISMMPNTMPPTATRLSRAPRPSKRGGCSSRPLGTTSAVPTKPTAARLTLSQKNAGHSNHCSSSAATNTPIAAPPPATPKIARPTSRMPLRPTRSPIAPDASSRPAKTTV